MKKKIKGLIALQKICERFPLNSTSDLIIPIEKELKALEIIKEKEVDCGFLKSCIVRFKEKALEHYNNIVWIYGHKPLTQEEYDLLREVLL